LAEWLYEEGIGENRAVLIEDGRIIEAEIELPGHLRAGAVLPGRLASILVPGRRGIVSLESGGEALLEPLPAQLTEGQRVHVEIVREPIGEEGRDKLAKARVADEEPREAPSLGQRIRRTGGKALSQGPDLLEQAGWSELLEEASSGEISFPVGSLRMSLTPAMTLFDVDGPGTPAELACAGAAAAARAIRRLGISGSIGVDLPTLPAKADRQAAAAAFDAELPPPFERTQVNGFGFLQIIRRRSRASLLELLQGDAVGAATRALLRRAERRQGTGPLTLTAAPRVIARIEREKWQDLLASRIGAAVLLRPEPGLAISAGHAHSQFP
jgi:hypothetical protein